MKPVAVALLLCGVALKPVFGGSPEIQENGYAVTPPMAVSALWCTGLIGLEPILVHRSGMGR